MGLFRCFRAARSPKAGAPVAGVMVITSLAMFAIALHYWRWGKWLTALVQTLVTGAFLVASLTKFLEGGFVSLSAGALAFITMATWRWGRKATFSAYAARSTLSMTEVVALHRSCKTFFERNDLIIAIARPRSSDSCGNAMAFSRAT